MTEHKPTLGKQTYNLAPWMKRRADGVGWEESEGAPHKRADWLPPDDPYNQLDVIWTNERHTDPHRVRDGDGCEAVVLGAAMEGYEASSSCYHSDVPASERAQQPPA
jgi:hypothetical protein